MHKTSCIAFTCANIVLQTEWRASLEERDTWCVSHNEDGGAEDWQNYGGGWKTEDGGYQGRH